jgi:hypothetical protein
LSRALEISANTLYSRAGLIDEELESPTISEAIDADKLLAANEKKLLLDMYRALIHSNGSVNKHTEQE